MKTGKPKAVVVLGPGRSGTSTVCGLLSALGVSFGRNLLPGDSSNPKGYFEDVDFLELNQKIYSEIQALDNLTPPPLREVLARKDKFARDAERVIGGISSDSELWGLKAWRVPMIEIFMPFIKDPAFVLIERDISDTARSLEKHISRRKNHRQISYEEAEKITRLYKDEVESFLERYPGVPVIKVSFEDILKGPRKESEALAKFIGLPASEKLLRRVEEFVVGRDSIGRAKSEAKDYKLSHNRLGRFIKKVWTNPKRLPAYLKNAFKNNIGR